ncbi:hypothetical protein Bca101_043737 [Brassica carinata]
MSSKTRDVLEGLVKDTSLKWLLGKQTSFDDEIQEIENSPSSGSNWIPELSPVANVVIRRCSKILGVSVNELQDSFEQEASGSVKQPSVFPRNFLEYSCFRALALSVGVTGHLSDKTFRCLTFDMMVAWEVPSASSQSLLSVDGDPTVGLEAFSRIAPAVPVIADVIICENLFVVLASSSSDGVRLHFSVYDKYLYGLERAIKKMKSQSESSLLSGFRSKGEKVFEIDGTVTTQPVLEHIGMSTWPGRLILTDHALYFEAIKVVSFDTPKRYSLSEDLKQVIKPELTGPWGTRLFDKAVSYKSVSLPEPVVMEFPELKGHTRRDYWLAIIREVLYVHRYINKFKIVTGVAKDEAISKAVHGVLRVQAIQELGLTNPVRYENLLLFNLCDELPGGDHILETLAEMSSSRVLDQTNKAKEGAMYSISASDMVSQLGLVFGSSPRSSGSLVVGEVVVGDVNPLEKAVKQSRKNYEKVVLAQETVNGVKVDGIDTNLAVMKELLLPVMEIGNWLLSLAYWDDPLKSFVFCLFSTFIIYRGWIGYVFAFASFFIAGFILLTRCFSKREKVMIELKVMAPPPMNTMEQLLAVQNSISQLEQLVQDANIVLLKLRALLLSLFPQASEKFAVAIVVATTMMVLLSWNNLILVVFLELFTRYSPPRRASTERLMRRLKEWWFSIPAAPVILEQNKDDNKKTK